MRFKKLELFGFKSFANKTTVHFEPGVTAIVGPNGSGKSNIVDGIRWVLGEHNPRDVRAPRLEDVIFNGTDRRAPLSMAEVHLTISNEQGLLPIAFSEVTLTRRVYRSGETECFINQNPCRLKDIRELFLGTGLGGGTYAIIEQGHIDMILSSKPEERRLVFEEASGVAKYLAKKQETIRRLEEVEEHLVRIGDITSEVRRQVSALERQAARARQYKTQWERLKQLELRLSVDELRTGGSRARELESALQDLQRQRGGLEGQKAQHVKALEGCNVEVSGIQDQLQAARTAVVECASQIEQHAGQLALKQQWITELRGQIEQVTAEAGQLHARLDELQSQMERAGGAEAEVAAQLEQVAGQLSQGREQLAALESALQAAQQTVNRAKTALFAAASAAASERNRANELTSQLRGLEAHLGRLEGQRTQQQANDDDVRERLQAASRERDGVQAELEGLRQQIESTQPSLDEAGARRHELSGRVHQLREEAANQRAQVELVEDLWRRYEGFSETVQMLMSQRIEGVVGPLADIVQAREGYEDVVEASLGPLAEAVVVADRQALERCRQVLDGQQLESARFLVLSDCPTYEIALAQTALSRDGVSVKNFVRVEPSYQRLIDWVLNDSWFINDLRPLLDQGVQPDVRLVSQRGERWDRRSWRLVGAPRPAGTSSGGRVGRRQRWQQAAEAQGRIDEQLTAAHRDSQDAEQRWQALFSQQETSKGRLTQLTETFRKLQAQVGQFETELARLAEEQRVAGSEIGQLQEQQTQRRGELAQAQQAVAEAEAQHLALEESLAQSQAAREESGARHQELQIAQAQVQSSLQSLTERRQSLLARRRELEQDRDALSRQLEAKARQRAEAAQRIETLERETGEHRAEADRLTAERQDRETQAQRVAEALAAAEATRNQVLPQLLAVEQQLSSLGQTLQEQNQQLAEQGFRRSRLFERLRDLYQIDEATIDAELRAESPVLTPEQRTEASDEVQKLRGKLEGIGAVSLGSVEEYDELKRRLEFLESQQQDLVQARDDLKTSIAQINKTARTQFRETFERIRVEFQNYYGKLFNGGQADLILMNQEDVLDSGIDIVARPPGKRLQTISLLSGGERALTAVALLFALFKVRPSPFCILDEIDAPLDEANVDRFTRVLEEFLALSQFILITHNKKTITKADSLYGVTMEEAGISKILSAKLKAADRPQPALSAHPG